MSFPAKKDLEIQLSKLSSFHNPKNSLEQYSTDPVLAAYVINLAFQRGDIQGKNVIDLGTGTGTLSYGALYFECKELTAVEVDEDQRSVLEKNLEKFSNKKLIFGNVASISGTWDTVLCNGPFGSVVKDADLPFLEKAFSLGKVVYLIHNWKAKDFIVSYASRRCTEFSYERRTLNIPRIYGHHEKNRMNIDVLFLVGRI